MNILYVHGLGSDKNSSTGKLIKEYYGKKHQVLTESFDLLNVEGTRHKIRKRVQEWQVDLCIASSLGAFFMLSLRDILPCFVINPCMKTSTVLKNLDASIPDEVLQEFAHLENHVYDNLEPTTRELTFAAFGTADELFSFKQLFLEKYGETNVLEVAGGKHKLVQEELYRVLEDFTRRLVP